MRILDLTNSEKSDIKYKISKFPDGQQDIVLDTEFVFKAGIYDTVNIHSRFNSFLDLELIICATKALRRLEIKDINLYIPYVLGARSDREFQKGGTSYLVDVIAPILNFLEFGYIRVLDVHSNIAPACINRLKMIDNSGIVYKSLLEIGLSTAKNLPDFVLISPDAGALNKVYTLAKNISFEGDIVTASKHRDLEGKLTKTEVPINFDAHKNKDFVIVDDICDGGRTFINIAKAIRDKTSSGKIYLIVTHGIFSNGLKELSQYFDHIYTTNSIMDIPKETEFSIRNGRYLDKVTQINVF